MDKKEKSSQSIHEFLEKTKNMKPIEAGTKLLGLKEDEIKNILEQKNEENAGEKNESPLKVESKEKIEKLPELEDKNFRIDSKNRKEIKDPNGVKVKENPEGDVREYLEGDYKGEQLFTQKSSLRETKKAGKTLPPSWETYKDIIEKKYKGNIQNFLKGENIMLAGGRHPEYGIDEIGRKFYLRCANGYDFDGHYSCYTTDGISTFGYSVRCLKN